MVFLSFLGGMDIWVILLIALLLFGGAKLPQLARSMGASVNEFKKGLKEGTDDEAKAGAAPAAKKDAP